MRGYLGRDVDTTVGTFAAGLQVEAHMRGDNCLVTLEATPDHPVTALLDADDVRTAAPVVSCSECGRDTLRDRGDQCPSCRLWTAVFEARRSA